MKKTGWISIAAFLGVHVACVWAFWTGVSSKAIALAVVSYAIRMFGITAGYHRYFSHRSYKANRIVQFAMGWIGCSSAQKGPLWWASHHRLHHQNSDTPVDIHSPVQDGFWWSHIGWILSSRYDHTEEKVIPDLLRFPELRWLDRFHIIPVIVWALGCIWIDGTRGFVWGFLISTTVLWHTTFLINSAAHVFGKRRFPTTDTSRNNVFLALLTFGEGWHNNHHYFPSSANQGFYWWEVDLSYYVLRVMEKLGLTSELRKPPDRIIELGRRLDAKSTFVPPFETQSVSRP